MTPLLLRSALLAGGLLLAAGSVSAQRSSSRSTPTPAPPPVTTGPTIVIVGEEAAPPPPTDSRSSRRSRSSGRSDAALELLWPKLGAGNASTIDVNKNPRLRLLLPSMGISVPRDGILRKPRGGSPTASSGSAQPPAVGPIAINLEGNYLVPDPQPPGGGPVIVVVAGEGGVTTLAPTSSGSTTRSSSDRRASSGSTYPTWAGGSNEGDRQPLTAAAPGEDEDERPEVTRHDNLPKTAPDFWQAFDQDHDAQLSLFEWRTGGKAVDDFLALDTNKDGQLELDEYAAGVASAVVKPEPAPPASRYDRFRR